MKATQRDIAAVLPRAARQCGIFFFCGPDEAGAAATADKLAALLKEAGERVELTGPALKADPALLADEARSASLFGGTRHLFVRAAGEEAHDALKGFLELADAGETTGACPILIHATAATDKSRTAKLLIPRKDALVAMFWPPDLASVTGEVRAMADEAGLRLPGELAQRIARAARLDLRLARSEITKLALYLDASPLTPRMADADALDAVSAVTEDDSLAPVVNAALSGALDLLPAQVRRMRELGLSPVGVTLALERRTAQLVRLTARLAAGGDIKTALEAERVYFDERQEVTRQLSRWNAGKLDRLINRLAELHRVLLTNSAAAELLLAQALVEIARVAAGRNG